MNCNSTKDFVPRTPEKLQTSFLGRTNSNANAHTSSYSTSNHRSSTPQHHQHNNNNAPSFSASDMRQLTHALGEAREGTGHVRSILLSASFRPRLPGLTKIVSKLSKEGSWKKALEVFETVPELNLHADTALTNAAISSCDKGGRWQAALEIFSDMESKGLSRDAITYSATISALAKGKQWQIALQIFDHMQNAGVEADVVTCCSLINALERGGQWQLGEKLFLQMCCTSQQENEEDGKEEHSTHGTNPLHKTHHHHGQSQQQKQKPRGLLRSQTSPNILIAPSKHAIDLPAVLEDEFLYKESKMQNGPCGDDDCHEESLSPAINTTTTADPLIIDPSASSPRPAADVDDGNTEQSTNKTTSVFATFAKIETENNNNNNSTLASTAPNTTAITISSSPPSLSSSPPSSPPAPYSSSSHTVSTMLTPFATAALTMQKHYPSSHLSLQSMSSIDSTHSKNASTIVPPGSISAAPHRRDTVGSSLSNGSLPSTPFSLGISDLLLPLPRSSHSSHLHARRTDTQHQNAAAHLHRAMSCFPDVDPGQAPGTSGLASMFNFSHAARIAPNRVCCNALLAAYGRATPSQWQRALHLIDAMFSGGPSLIPDAVSYNTVIKACLASFQVTHAIEIYNQMIHRGLRPNAATYSSLLNAASDTKNIPALQSLGETLGTAPTEARIACMNPYIAAMAGAGAWDAALHAFRDMLSPRSPCYPTATTFHVILSGLVHRREFAAALKMLEEMKSVGVQPSLHTYHALLCGFAEHGAWQQSLDVLKMMLAVSGVREGQYRYRGGGLRNESICPTTMTFNVVFTALHKAAISHSSAPFNNNNNPTNNHLLSVIAAATSTVFQQMQSLAAASTATQLASPPYPDRSTYTTIISIFFHTGHPAEIVAVHDMILSHNNVLTRHAPITAPTTTTSSSTVAASTNSGGNSSNLMISLDPDTEEKIISASISVGHLFRAFHLCKSMHSKAGNIKSSLLLSLFTSSMTAKMWDVAIDVCISFPGSFSGEEGGVIGMLKNVMHNAADAGQYTVAHQIQAILEHASSLNTTSVSTVEAIDSSAAFSVGKSAAAAAAPYLDVDTSGILDRSVWSNVPPQHAAPVSIPCVVASAAETKERRGTDTTSTTSTTSTTNTAAIIHGDQAPLSLADVNAMLCTLCDMNDVHGCLMAFSNMKLAGIVPDATSYFHVINTLVKNGQREHAVEICKEGHACGILFKSDMLNPLPDNNNGTAACGGFMSDEPK